MKYAPALWAVAGAAIAALVIPTASAAVTSQLVSITDPTSGVKASVDASHRLRIAEAPINNIVTIGAQVVNQCSAVYTVPAGKTLVIKTISMAPANASSNNSEVSVYRSADCSGTSIAQGLVFDSAGGATNDNIDLGPGVVVKAGTAVSMTTNNTYVDVHLYGYLLP
jgi:hypothetical protein